MKSSDPEDLLSLLTLTRQVELVEDGVLVIAMRRFEPCRKLASLPLQEVDLSDNANLTDRGMMPFLTLV